MYERWRGILCKAINKHFYIPAICIYLRKIFETARVFLNNKMAFLLRTQFADCASDSAPQRTKSTEAGRIKTAQIIYGLMTSNDIFAVLPRLERAPRRNLSYADTECSFLFY